jgi:hypothetical protein
VSSREQQLTALLLFIVVGYCMLTTPAKVSHLANIIPDQSLLVKFSLILRKDSEAKS